MEQKKKYRLLLIMLFVLNILMILIYGVLYVQGRIPDHLYVKDGESISVDNAFTLKKSRINMLEDRYLMPVGEPVGLYIQTKGVLVLGTGKITDSKGDVQEPSRDIFQTGDYIEKINDQDIRSISQVLYCIQHSDGGNLDFQIRRNGARQCINMKPVQTADGQYKIGVWLRNDTQGIGTITYIDENQQFAALGHGITDMDTGILMEISHGMVYNSDILTVVKGKSGNPGEIVGIIHYQQGNKIGSIEKNTPCGIFGHLNPEKLAFYKNQALPVAQAEEIEKGPAEMICSIAGEKRAYAIEIVKIDVDGKDTHKNLEIHITDEQLLDKTNGILQGMSGSPIIQNGKFVGAVTHVFVNDPSRGYGIWIGNMLDH